MGCSREEREYRRARLAQNSTDQDPERGTSPKPTGNAPPPYRDDPSVDDVGLEASSSTRLLDEEDAIDRPIRKRRRNCCVCCGVRCDIVFKALGIVLGLYLCYGIFKLVRWAVTPSPTGLEGMPEYSTSLGCSDAPFTYHTTHFSMGLPVDDSTFTLELTGGAVGTVFLTQSDTREASVEMDLHTDEEPLLQKVSASLNDNTTTKISAFRLTTPSSASSPDACMRFDITVQIPPALRALTVKSQSLVHVKYDEHTPLSLSDLTIDLTSTLSDNLLLPHEQLGTTRTTLKMRRGFLAGSLAFSESADISTSRGSAVTNLKVSPLPSSDDRAAQLTTNTGSGRADIIYANPDLRGVASSHSSTGGDLYLTYKQAGYNGRVDVQAKSTTSSGLQGMMVGRPGTGSDQGRVKELPWVGDKEGKDTMKVRTSGWVGLYF
ncbi:hypothetical protein K439DRAFT_1188087 [Ramaria rubella]|nr:hypothetical protein K439DRAFT_1188087 [Ramaria rubella]